jgi:hypothetical protein
LYGLDQSGVILTNLYILMEFTKSIGLPQINEDGDYIEYRDTYLTIGATNVFIGQGPGSGSGRIKLNTSTNQTSLNVFDSGRPSDESLESILWKGTNINNVVEIVKGSLGIAVLPGESAAILTYRQRRMRHARSQRDT